MHPFRARTALAAAAALLLALPVGASASASVEIGIADENVLNGVLDGDKPVPGGTDAVVAQWKASGVQDVRIFAQWNKLAPQRDDPKMPAGFLGDDPAAYDLTSLDQKIDAVVKHGLNVTLVVTGPGPVWGSTEPARRNGTWKPSPKLFGKFATAIAKHVGDRVNRYIVWNEPNQQLWLQPQNSCVVAKSGRNVCDPVAPHVYRDLARAGYTAINAADPQARVAVGATSSRGTALAVTTTSASQPLKFLRAMACVTASYKPITTGDCKAFKPVTGDALAYHPHSLRFSPGQHDPDTNNARMGDLDRLTGVLDRLTTKGRLKVAHAKRLPLWLDEYGYETNPPDTQGDGTVSPKTAAAWVQWAGSIAARNPRVETLTQYEWFDEPTGTDQDRQFNRWQSGLYTLTGKPKPLAAVFAHPIFGWRTATRGHVWGQVRPGEGATRVRLQRRTGKTFRAYRTVKTDRYGTFQVRVPVSATARYRFVYPDPTTGADVTSGVTTLRKG